MTHRRATCLLYAHAFASLRTDHYTGSPSFMFEERIKNLRQNFALRASA
jgi:hypothetical protein